MAAPVGAPSVAALLAPSSTTRITDVGARDWIAGAPFRAGNKPATPLPEAPWQAAHSSP